METNTSLTNSPDNIELVQDKDETSRDVLSLEKVPEEFPFPFKPYDIQLNFMKNIYYVLENRKFGIFESPTGTGKSLSLICGTLKWYYDNQEKEINQLNDEIHKLEKLKIENNCKFEDWIEQQSYEIKMDKEINEVRNKISDLNNYKEYISRIKKENKRRKQSLKSDLVPVHALTYKGKQTPNTVPCEQVDDAQPKVDLSSEECKEFSEYMNKIDENNDMLPEDTERNNLSDEDEAEDQEQQYKDIKIYFCSRTHSQLSQFIKEINKTVYNDRLRVTVLSSRANYCINENVNKLKNIQLVNEKCIEINKAKSKPTQKDENEKVVKKQKCKTVTCKCPYKNETGIEDLKNEIISNVHDIEEIVSESKTIKACPYYSTRLAIKDSQMIVLPYNILLHKTTREMCNINLKDSIVVVDEAHNLLDTIENIHSCMISGDSVFACYNQINNYKTKFLSKFNSTNLLFINQIIYLLKMIIHCIRFKHLIERKKPVRPIVTNESLQSSNEKPSVFQPPQGDTTQPPPEESKLFTLSDFLMENNIDNINIFKVLEFIKQSRLCYKLQNYSLKYRDCTKPAEIIEKLEVKPRESHIKGLQNFLNRVNKGPEKVEDVKQALHVEDKDEEPTVRNPMLSFVSFLESLINKNEDGRVLITTHPQLHKTFIKYILLNPASYFHDIVRECRSIVLAGGTMEPISEFKDQLFKSLGVKDSRIHHFSCGHVIPKDNILPIILCNGPTKKSFDLTFENRAKPEILKEISMTITNLCNIIPKGVVCFFPSYDYENIVYNFLNDNGFLERITKKKDVYREPKKTSDVDKTLSNFAKSVDQGGAIMLSVVGGKLSEGLNFSNDLGRCVIVIGMPFANVKSLYIQEKMKYLNTNVYNGAGNDYYKNNCMKGVNQSIGRAIRHANDYACMILIHQRYTQPSIQNLLPLWIRQHLVVSDSFPHMFKHVNQFFQQKKQS